MCFIILNSECGSIADEREHDNLSTRSDVSKKATSFGISQRIEDIKTNNTTLPHRQQKQADMHA